MSASTPRAPSHLSSSSKKLWRQIVADYQLASEPHALEILRLALESIDRAAQARKEIDANGITVLDRYGVAKANPAIAIERDSALRAMRAFRELSLDGEVDFRVPRVGGARS